MIEKPAHLQQPHLPPSETKLRRFSVSVLCMSDPPAWLILEVHQARLRDYKTIRGLIIAPSGHVFSKIASDASRFYTDGQDLMAQQLELPQPKGLPTYRIHILAISYLSLRRPPKRSLVEQTRGKKIQEPTDLENHYLSQR